MNIPDNKKLEKFNSIDVETIRRGVTPSTEVIYRLYRRNNATRKVYKITGRIFVQNKAINTITPEIGPLYDEFVNSRYNYKDLTTTDDDRSRYITSNILPRYDDFEIRTYAKYSSPNDNAPVIENKYTEQELIQNGFELITGIETSKIRANDYDLDFTYTLPNDKNVTLAFIVTLKSV